MVFFSLPKIQGVLKDLIGKPVQVRRGPATVNRSRSLSNATQLCLGKAERSEIERSVSACESGDLPRMMLKCSPAENRSNATASQKSRFHFPNGSLTESVGDPSFYDRRLHF